MRLCLTTVVYLSGLAACSHQGDNTAKSAETPQTAAEEAHMRPASLEASAPARPATAADPVTPRADARNDTSAPLVADTKGTGSNDFNGGSAPSGAAPHKEETASGKADARDANRPTATQPDNTAVNERDRSAQAVTPLDQGNGKQDLDITQQIRKAVMADSSLSFTAKNVKIITNGGKVTLRGPVKTAEERSAIETAARKVAGNNVDNQIEIKK